MTTTTVYMTGNTYPSREILKERGWKWVASRGVWTINADSELVAAAAAKKEGARGALAASVRGLRVGCMIYAIIDGQIASLWTHKGYPAWEAKQQERINNEY